MHWRGARWVAAMLATCGTLATGPSALADERTDAARQFRAGMKLVGERRYDEGIARLQRAYDILPHPNVLYNIALAHMSAGRPREALEAFEAYKAMVRPEEALEVDPIVEQLKQTVGDPSRASAPPPTSTPASPPTGEPRGVGDPIQTVEAAARDLRRQAEEQNDPALRQQADDLDRLASDLRRSPGESPVQSAVEAPNVQSPTQTPDQPNSIQPQTLPVTPEQPSATENVYKERVVSASRVAQSPLDAPNATAIITAQDIRLSGVTQLSMLLRRVAGVEVNTVAPYHSEISIRGLNQRSSNKVLLLWDGRPVRMDFMGTNWIDMLPLLVDDIERIEIIRGPASALYGADAFSGVINIITRRPGEGGSFAVARYGNHGHGQGGVTASGRNGPFSFRASTMYTQAYNSEEVVAKDRVDIRRPDEGSLRGYQAVGLNGDLAYDFAKQARATVGGNYSAGTYTIQGLSRLGQVVTDDSFIAQLYGSLVLPGGVRIGSSYQLVHGHPSAAFIAPGAIGADISVITQRGYDGDLSWTGKGHVLFDHNLTVGVTYRYRQIEWDWLDQKHTQHHVGVYLQDIIQLAEPLRLQIGARMDRHPLLNNLQFSPRASLMYRFFGEQSLRLSAGRAFRGPTFLESYLDLQNETPLRGVTATGRGNAKLDPESITSLELGYQNQQSEYFALEANLYYNWVKDTILLTAVDPFTVGDYARGGAGAGYNRQVEAFPVSSLGFANERASYRQMGAEVGVRIYPVEGLDVYGNYSIHDTSPVDKAKVDPARAAQQQTSLHKVNGGIQFRSWFGLEAAVDVSWFSKQLWIEQVTDVAQGVRWQRYPQDGFLMLNARLGYRLLGDRLELGVVGTNLANADKRQHPLAQTLDTRVLGTAKVRF